jgi:hypothetical protein
MLVRTDSRDCQYRFLCGSKSLSGQGVCPDQIFF